MWKKSIEISMEDEGSRKTRRKMEFPKKMKKILKNLWNVGKEDTRRVKHALKVGVSLTLVSLLYLMEPFFKGIGKNAIWAVMTVVVVLEFSAGATLRKGLNRGLGTLIAGSLAYLMEFVAINSGKIFGGIFIGAAVFIIGPPLITIAHQRLFTIAMGIGICLVMSLLVFPIWSGDDLHKSTVTKFQGLSRSIEACVSEYFEGKEKDRENSDSDSESDDEDVIYKGYKTVLDSKSSDEALWWGDQKGSGRGRGRGSSSSGRGRGGAQRPPASPASANAVLTTSDRVGLSGLNDSQWQQLVNLLQEREQTTKLSGPHYSDFDWSG